MEAQKKRFPRIYLILIIIAAILLTLHVLWEIFCSFFPPSHSSGVELYESGAYLALDDGELFARHMAELPFTQDAQILSFDYYDFAHMDTHIPRHKPFPDFYMVQIDPAISFDAVVQYLQVNSTAEKRSEDDSYSVFNITEVKTGSEHFFVAVNYPRQEIYCFLIGYTDSVVYKDGEYYFFGNISTAPPWE